MTDTSRETAEQHIKVICELEKQLNAGGCLVAERPVSGFSNLTEIVRALLDERDMLAKALSDLAEETVINAVADLAPDVLDIAEERDAAIARAEKAEVALEAAHIEGCRMGLTAVLREAKNNWEFVGEDFTRGVAWVINELNPAQIVKEHGK